MSGNKCGALTGQFLSTMPVASFHLFTESSALKRLEIANTSFAPASGLRTPRENRGTSSRPRGAIFSLWWAEERE